MALSKKTTTTLMLYIGVAALAMLAWSDYQMRKKAEKAPVFDLSTSSVQEFSATRTGSAPLQFMRKDEQWYLVSPIQALAHQSRTLSLLQIIRQRPTQRYNPSEVDLAGAGLLEPEAEISIYGKRILFGKKEPITGQRYVSMDESVFLLDDYYFQLLSGGASAMANLRILPSETLEVTGLFIDGTKQPFDKVIWENAKAGGIQASLGDAQGQLVRITLSDGSERRFHAQNWEGFYSLHPENSNYELLFDESLAHDLSLLSKPK